MTTTRILPLCSRRTGANFWTVQELGPAGWADRPGVFPTKGDARRAIEAHREGRAFHQDVDLLARSVAPTNATQPQGPQSQPARFGASPHTIPGYPKAVLYRVLEPSEYLERDRALAHVRRLEAEAARRQLIAETGYAMPPIPPIALLTRTEDVLRADFVDTAGPRRLQAAVNRDASGALRIVVVAGRLLPTAACSAYHEMRHVWQFHTQVPGDRLTMERDAVAFQLRHCRGGCPEGAHGELAAQASASEGVTLSLASLHEQRRAAEPILLARRLR